MPIINRIRQFLMLCLPVITVQADDMTMAVPDDAYPPYVVHNDQGEAIHGLLIDPLRAALTALEMSLELLELPVLRSTYMLDAGKLDARMESPQWLGNPDDFLWLDVGVTLEDILVYRADLPYVPDSLTTLEGSEIITHLGYIYPTLDPLFHSGKLTRLDKHTEREMIDALLNAPAESPRLLVIERKVWEWYLPQLDIPPHIRLQVSPLLVGCAQLQIQLARTARLETLQPRLQGWIDAHHPAPALSACTPAS